MLLPEDPRNVGVRLLQLTCRHIQKFRVSQQLCKDLTCSREGPLSYLQVTILSVSESTNLPCFVREAAGLIGSFSARSSIYHTPNPCIQYTRIGAHRPCTRPYYWIRHSLCSCQKASKWRSSHQLIEDEGVILCAVFGHESESTAAAWYTPQRNLWERRGLRRKGHWVPRAGRHQTRARKLREVRPNETWTQNLLLRLMATSVGKFHRRELLIKRERGGGGKDKGEEE